MVSKRVVDFPDGAQSYLEERFGIRRYSDRHLTKLVQLGVFPPPIVISPRRRASRLDELDAYAEKLLNRQSA
jgi:hypothetical protein